MFEKSEVVEVIENGEVKSLNTFIKVVGNLFTEPMTREVKLIHHPSKRANMDDRAIIYYLKLSNFVNRLHESGIQYVANFHTQWGLDNGIRQEYLDDLEQIQKYSKYKYDEFVRVSVPGYITFLSEQKIYSRDFTINVIVPVQPNQPIHFEKIEYKNDFSLYGQSVEKEVEVDEGIYEIHEVFERVYDNRDIDPKTLAKLSDSLNEFEQELQTELENYIDFELVSNF